MACTASSASSPSDARLKTSVTPWQQRRDAARKMACLLGKSRKRYGCETPTRLAMTSVEVPL